MKKLSNQGIRILLVVAILFCQLGQAAPQRLDEATQQQLRSKLEKQMSETELKEIYNESNSNIIIGPYYENSSLRSFHLDESDAAFFFDSLNEERISRDLPEKDFLGVKEKYIEAQVSFISPQIDLSQHPDFFDSVQARFEEKKHNYLEQRKQSVIQLQAERSARSDRKIQNINFVLRWGTSVFFFSAIVQPSNLELVAITSVSAVATYLYNNMMPFYEALLSKGGKAILSAPVKLMDMTHKIHSKTPFVSSYGKQILPWAQEIYQNKILKSENWKNLSQLSVSFAVSSMFVATYAIVMNLSEVGLAASSHASGSSIIEFGKQFWDISSWKFAEGFQFSNFIEALRSDITQFQFQKLVDFLETEPIFLKAGIFTIYAETWTIYRMKYRNLVTDQSKANRLGWMLGAFFALMAPIIHRSSDVLMGRATDALSISGVVLAGGIGVAGLIYMFGDGPKFFSQLSSFFSRKYHATKDYTQKTLRAGLIAFGESSQLQSNYSFVNKYSRTQNTLPWSQEKTKDSAYCRFVF